ncbi:MAG: SAM-dependent methyltransferase [Lactobacillales bacterium]|nr:SAM-dependent methyltransferase [Lactobacillales bacterium]
MNLTKRLNAIVNLIDEGTNVIDIGCDHALLDIYLTLNNKNKCIASDINENALKSAKKNIKKYNLEKKIKVIVSDGLKNIDIPSNNTIVICGMGTNTILNILKASNIKNIDNLIIQSNNDLYLLRKSLVKLGFYIEKEINLKDKNKYYTIIKLKKGLNIYSNLEYYYGINLENKEFVQYLINKNNEIIKKLPKKYLIKKIKYKIHNNYLKKHL